LLRADFDHDGRARREPRILIEQAILFARSVEPGVIEKVFGALRSARLVKRTNFGETNGAACWRYAAMMSAMRDVPVF
jgi:hypothetical protein